MTTATISQAPRRAVSRLGNLRWLVRDVAVLARPSLARIAREPETLMDFTIQPILFVLLFAYVFGGAIALPGGGSYHEYLIGGVLAMGRAASGASGGSGRAHYPRSAPPGDRPRRGRRDRPCDRLEDPLLAGRCRRGVR